MFPCFELSVRINQSNASRYPILQKLRCPKCPEEGGTWRISPAFIANQVKKQAEGFMSTYYRGMMMCDDETCNYTTRSLNLDYLGIPREEPLVQIIPAVMGIS